MERTRRRKAQGLQDRYLYGYTFANDNGENPVMAKAHAYVDHWPKRSRGTSDCCCSVTLGLENPSRPGASLTPFSTRMYPYS